MRIFRNYRKGEEILVPETLGLAIALIGLVALAFFGVKLYNMFVEQDLKNAQAFVDGLSSKIEALDENAYCGLPQASPPSEVGFSPPKCEVSNTFALRGVEGWVLVGWNKSIPITEDDKLISANLKPQKCFDKSCLCLCEEKVSNCQENGYCRAMDRDVSVVSKLNYSNVFSSLGEGEVFSENNIDSFCIHLIKSSLMDINVLKNSGKIIVSYDYGEQKTLVGAFTTEKNEILDILDGESYEGSSVQDLKSYVKALRNRCSY